MSFYENGLTWPFYLFIYIFPPPPPPPPVPVKLHCRFWIAWDREGWTCPFKTHRMTHYQKLPSQSTSMTSHPPFFSIDHLALSSINLQNALFKLLINILIDLQKCHNTPRQELLMVVSPQRRGSRQSGNDECQNECVHRKYARQGQWIWDEVSTWTGKVVTKM